MNESLFSWLFVANLQTHAYTHTLEYLTQLNSHIHAMSLPTLSHHAHTHIHTYISLLFPLALPLSLHWIFIHILVSSVKSLVWFKESWDFMNAHTFLFPHFPVPLSHTVKLWFGFLLACSLPLFIQCSFSFYGRANQYIYRTYLLVVHGSLIPYVL